MSAGGRVPTHEVAEQQAGVRLQPTAHRHRTCLAHQNRQEAPHSRHFPLTAASLAKVAQPGPMSCPFSDTMCVASHPEFHNEDTAFLHSTAGKGISRSLQQEATLEQQSAAILLRSAVAGVHCDHVRTGYPTLC